MAYRLIRWLLGIISRVFFRQIEVVGLENVPREGGVIFAGNHPNSLLDPMLIITTCGLKVHFAAKDTLFKSKLLRGVLHGLGAVPIARRDDHPGAPKLDNASAFSAMHEVLDRGGAIGIFPEGLSHDESQLAKLKTGAARLALGAGSDLVIVPCGLTFVHPARFRSRVLVQYGSPIRIDAAEREAFRVDAQTASRDLTNAIEGGMRSLTINAPDWETVRALDEVRRLYQPLDITIEQRIELARRFNQHYGSVKDEPNVVKLMGRVRDYQERLDEMGLSDRELARDLPTREVAMRVVRYLGLILFWLPLTLPGAPIHVPTVLFARFAGKKLTPRKDVIATTKVLSGVLAVLLAYAVVVSYVAWRYGLWAILVACVLPMSGHATLKVLDRLKLLGHGLGTLARRLRWRREVVSLRAERKTLQNDIIAIVNELRPKDLELLFPQKAQQA